MTESEIKEMKYDCINDIVLKDVLLDLNLEINEEIIHLDYEKYKIIKEVVEKTRSNILKQLKKQYN